MGEVRPISEAPLHYDPEWAYVFHVVLKHASAPRVLLLDGPDGWALPHFVSPEHDLRAVGPLQRMIRARFGLAAVVLQCVEVDRSRVADKHVDAVFAVEALDPAWRPPPDGRWHGQAGLAALPFARPEHRVLINTWLSPTQAQEGRDDLHPWVMPGWYATAAAWIEHSLNPGSDGPALSIEQVRSWDLSCVLRIRTPKEELFFKALPPAYRSEVTLTHALSALYPDHIPQVRAVDEEQGWMVLGNTGPLMPNEDITLWEAAVRLLARLQLESRTQIARLLAAGCLDQRLDQLAAQADLLVGDADVCALLDTDDYARLCSVGPWLKERCRQLAAYGLPPTLVHGDMHTGNIALRQDHLVVFDWGDGCIAHPFFDLFALLDEDYFPPGVADAGIRLRDLYLAQWTDYASPDDLRAAYEVARPLAILRYTIGCQRCFASLDRLWTAELAPSLRWCVRTLLQHVPGNS